MRRKQFIEIEKTRQNAIAGRFRMVSPELLEKMAENPPKHDPLLKGISQQE